MTNVDSGESYVEWQDAVSSASSFKRRGTLLIDEDSEPESDLRYYSLTSGSSSDYEAKEIKRTFQKNFKDADLVMSEKLFKVIIIGDPTVGKTSFVQRYVQNTFKRDYKGTVGVDFALKIIKWSETQTIKLQLWDIAGQERFTWMTRVYYKDAQGCVIMFDLTNKNSFINTLKWKKDVDSKCVLPDGRPIPCILLANKCDLTQRQVDIMDIEGFHKEHNFIGWTETSAKEEFMVNDSMKFLVEVMMRQVESEKSLDDDDFIRLTKTRERKNKCSC